MICSQSNVTFKASFRVQPKLGLFFLFKIKSIKYFGSILDELKQNTLGYHWMKAEEDYPVHHFIREINEGSLN